MKLIELLPFQPYISIKEVKDVEQAEFEARNESEWILLSDKDYEKFVDSVISEIRR